MTDQINYKAKMHLKQICDAIILRNLRNDHVLPWYDISVLDNEIHIELWSIKNFHDKDNKYYIILNKDKKQTRIHLEESNFNANLDPFSYSIENVLDKNINLYCYGKLSCNNPDNWWSHEKKVFAQNHILTFFITLYDENIPNLKDRINIWSETFRTYHLESKELYFLLLKNVCEYTNKTFFLKTNNKTCVFSKDKIFYTKNDDHNFFRYSPYFRGTLNLGNDLLIIDSNEYMKYFSSLYNKSTFLNSELYTNYIDVLTLLSENNKVLNFLVSNYSFDVVIDIISKYNNELNINHSYSEFDCSNLNNMF